MYFILFSQNMFGCWSYSFLPAQFRLVTTALILIVGRIVVDGGLGHGSCGTVAEVVSGCRCCDAIINGGGNGRRSVKVDGFSLVWLDQGRSPTPSAVMVVGIHCKGEHH